MRRSLILVLLVVCACRESEPGKEQAAPMDSQPGSSAELPARDPCDVEAVDSGIAQLLDQGTLQRLKTETLDALKCALETREAQHALDGLPAHDLLRLSVLEASRSQGEGSGSIGPLLTLGALDTLERVYPNLAKPLPEEIRDASEELGTARRIPPRTGSLSLVPTLVEEFFGDFDSWIMESLREMVQGAADPGTRPGALWASWRGRWQPKLEHYRRRMGQADRLVSRMARHDAFAFRISWSHEATLESAMSRWMAEFEALLDADNPQPSDYRAVKDGLGDLIEAVADTRELLQQHATAFRVSAPGAVGILKTHHRNLRASLDALAADGVEHCMGESCEDLVFRLIDWSEQCLRVL